MSAIVFVGAVVIVAFAVLWLKDYRKSGRASDNNSPDDFIARDWGDPRGLGLMISHLIPPKDACKPYIERGME